MGRSFGHLPVWSRYRSCRKVVSNEEPSSALSPAVFINFRRAFTSRSGRTGEVMSQARLSDGSAGDVDYGRIGGTYSHYRRPEPAIALQIRRALGDAKTVLNVGAGAGSYEPTDCDVTAVEPSAAMRAQRPSHLAVAIDAVAESLPFEDDSFDASMASVTVHQWSNLDKLVTVKHEP